MESHFSNFNQVTNDPSLLNWVNYWCFTSLGKTLGYKKQFEASLFDGKFKNYT